MHRDQIQGILRHCFRRQEDSGPESAFRFLSYAGPNRIPLSANYPRPGLTEETTHTAKNKGKGRDTSQLNNLLPLSRNFTPNPTGATGAQDDWVRIDMQQMIKLRDMGHEPRGPVNGPNEGLPEYEVPKSWLQLLALAPSPTPSLMPTRDWAIPSPQPNPCPHSALDIAPNNSVIDPSLLELTNANAVAGPSRLQLPAPAPTPIPNQMPTGNRTYPRPRPIPPRPSELNNAVTLNPPDPVVEAEVSGLGLPSGLPHAEPDSDGHPHAEPDSDPNEDSAPESLLPLPTTRPQTRSTKKRKVMSTDDLAAQEARDLLKGTSRRTRTRPRTRTRRRG